MEEKTRETTMRKALLKRMKREREEHLLRTVLHELVEAHLGFCEPILQRIALPLKNGNACGLRSDFLTTGLHDSGQDTGLTWSEWVGLVRLVGRTRSASLRGGGAGRDGDREVLRVTRFDGSWRRN
jgi:hypothetical protein